MRKIQVNFAETEEPCPKNKKRPKNWINYELHFEDCLSNCLQRFIGLAFGGKFIVRPALNRSQIESLMMKLRTIDD